MNTAPDGPLGVCALPPPPPNKPRTVVYPQYIHEILQHAGLCYRAVPLASLADTLPYLRLLVTVGDATLADGLTASLQRWVAQGGGWLAIGGVGQMPEMFGVEVEEAVFGGWWGKEGTLGEGYLRARQADHPILAHLTQPLHYFNGIPVRPADDATILADVLDAHQRPTPRAALVERRVGQGRCVLIAPDVAGTVVHIQQGRAITRDGIPAPDGSAPIADAVLKSGDGGVLDWLFDRRPMDATSGIPAYVQPVADQWREVVLRAIFHLATELDVPLPLLWLYPHNRPALAHLSHDTDGNEPEKAPILLAVLREAQIHATWCVILPGYAPDLLAQIRRAGHELATHYDAVSKGTAWSEAHFAAQYRMLAAMFGEAPVSNKNHLLRWEGDTEFFEWCTRYGIQLDQSKGPSKTGEGGFPFGTCHPYFPLAPDGTRLDVLELPTQTQDLPIFGPVALADVLFDAAEQHHGIAHFLFHPAHVDKADVFRALNDVIRQGQARGLVWWTARQINAWERARRQVHWHGYVDTGQSVHVALHTPQPMPGATVLWLTARPQPASVNGVAQPVASVQRWGFPFVAIVFDAQPEGEYIIALANKEIG